MDINPKILNNLFNYSDQVCIPSKAFRVLPGMRNWCDANCMRYPPNCPESVCYCP